MAQHQQKLHEVLAGPQGKKYGALPKIALPGDDETLLRFARDLLDILRLKPVYRRDNVAMFPYHEKARLEPMTAQAFRTFVDTYVAAYKTKFDEKGEPFDVLRSINKETSQGVLDCFEFWSGLREIVSVNPMPMPVLKWNKDENGKAVPGDLVLLQPGYDEETKALTFA